MVKKSNWNKFYLTTKRAVISAISLIFAISLLNVHMLKTFGVDIIVNGTRIVQCYSTPLDPSSSFMDIWGTVNMIVQFILKSFFILI
jgi:hypothetical protein